MKNILLSILFICSVSIAQEQSIAIGKTELKLGADKENILNQLDKSFYVEEDETVDNIFIIWDTNKRTYNYGYIEFDASDKLNSISKNWSSAVNDGYSKIFEQMIKIIESYKKDGDLIVETQEIFEPNYKAKTLIFIQGKKIIELSLVGNRIVLKESLKTAE